MAHLFFSRSFDKERRFVLTRFESEVLPLQNPLSPDAAARWRRLAEPLIRPDDRFDVAASCGETAMKLPRGITGFRHYQESPLEACDMKAFSAHCFAVARSVGGRVVRSPHRPNGVANFATAVLDMSGVQVAVLLNDHFPVIGFAVPPDEGSTGPLQFVDDDRLAEALRATGAYEVTNRAELEKPVNGKDLDLLAPAEIDQVKYWRPGRVGDVVFNFWD